jgi:hypothetical protein
MNDEQIRERLQMIGVRCFVRFFDLLADGVDYQVIGERLHKEQNRQYESGEPKWEPWRNRWDREAAINLRAHPACEIIRNGKARRALEIASVARLPSEDIQRAKELISRLDRN